MYRTVKYKQTVYDHREELELQLEIVQKYFDQAIEDKKQLEEKYKQLEATATTVSPSNSIPAVQEIH